MVRQSLLACLLGAVGLFVAYATVVGIGAFAGGWSLTTVEDQAWGLAVHGGVVLARGMLPTILLLLALQGAALRWFGLQYGAGLTSSSAIAASAVAVSLFLTRKLGSWPHLEIDGVVNCIATILLIGAGSAGAVLLAQRLLPRQPGAEPTPDHDILA